jgi:sugar phosphate isomerase/epimerase
LPEARRRLAICEFSTFTASFEEDLEAYAAAGVDGISICELKLVEGREREQLAAFRASGLEASSAIPAVPSILPLPALPGPEDPAERVEAIVAGMRRLAPFGPSAFVCPTGPAGALAPQEARRTVAEGLRVLADEAAQIGIPVGLEPMSGYEREDWTLVTTLGEAAALADEAGGGVGLVFDTWHLWDAPAVDRELERFGGRLVAVHVNDWRGPTRTWCDRTLPGDGVVEQLPALLDAVERTGWSGCYDLEVFSDDGTFGNDFEDSLWKLPAAEVARRGRAAFEAVNRQPLGAGSKGLY